MKGALHHLPIGALLLAATTSAQALKAPEVDLRDPKLWEEKKVNPLNDISAPAKWQAARIVQSGKIKSPIFSVKENGESNVVGNPAMSTGASINAARSQPGR